MNGYATIDHPALVRALGHPLRARILGLLQERRGSPSELSDELDAPLGNVSYHVRILAELKLIKLVKKTPRRGAIEHHYEAVSAARVTDKTWAVQPGLVKQAIAAASIEDVGRTVTEAAAAGGFERDEAQMVRKRVTLDEQGWSELASEVGRLSDRAEEIQTAATKRLRSADGGATPIEAAVVLMLFERLTAVAVDGVPADA